MRIPTYQQWIQDTSLGLTKPRSTQLKAIDEAIRKYETSKGENNLWAIKNALEDWKRSKGTMWETADRNRKKAVSQLNFELQSLDYRTYQITHFTMEELMALQVVARSRKQVIGNVFRNKQVTLKAARLKEQIAKVPAQVQAESLKAQTYLKSIGKKTPPSAGPSTSEKIQEKMGEMVKQYFGVPGIEALGSLSSVILPVVAQCSVSAAPVIGHIKDGIDLFVGWAKAGGALYEQHNISGRKYTIDEGAPAAAFDGLVDCLKEETRNETISASAATASFALKTGLVFADGGAISGPVIGAAKALADVAMKLYLLGVEWKATKAINDALETGKLDITLFDTYPLMGCYMLVSATLSDLIPIESFGTPGWMDYIEKMKKDSFDKIYESSTALIEKSPWEIQGLPKHVKGTSAGIVGEIKRIFSTVSPLSDLKDLADI